jgi:hypothetical protein
LVRGERLLASGRKVIANVALELRHGRIVRELGVASGDLRAS